MNKYNLGKYLVFVLCMGFIPGIASATNVYFETSRTNVSVGDTFIVSVKIDSKDTSINSVEGDIVLESNNENLIVNDFSLAKSIFNLWPRTPSLSKDGKIISFAGGVPGGFNLDKAILFNIVVEASKEGDIKITPKNMAIFANDGKGTRVDVQFADLNIKVAPKSEVNASINEWTNLVNSDKTNPEKFTIVVGKDANLFEGKRFAFFTAVDNQSGISYYEVSENGKPSIRSGSMYVLENQDTKSDIDLTVTAYDKAGNKTISVYENEGFTILGFSLNFILIIIGIIIVRIITKKVKNKKGSKENVQIDQ